MKTLVIYDNNGQIFNQITGDYKIPVGLQHLEVTIPDNHFIAGVDVSGEIHEVIYETHPPTETEILKAKSQELEETVSYLFTDVIPMLMGIATPIEEPFEEEPTEPSEAEEPTEPSEAEEPTEEPTEPGDEPTEEPIEEPTEPIEGEGGPTENEPVEEQPTTDSTEEDKGESNNG